jgi:antitoxin Phd
MADITSSHAKNHFGEVMEQARKETVTISKSGRPAVAMLDIAEYRRLRRIENDYWVNLANEAKASGMVGTDVAAAQLAALSGDGE